MEQSTLPGWFTFPRCHPMSTLVEAKKEIAVPGGLISIDPYRGKPGVVVWTRLLLSSVWRSYFAAERMERDIVIHDDTGERELYREGPYNNVTVARALEHILAAIQSQGLDAFLRAHQIASPRVGPVDAPSRVGFWGQVAPYLSGAKKDR